jgi:hypothetical protein
MVTKQPRCPAREELDRIQPAVGYPVVPQELSAGEREFVKAAADPRRRPVQVRARDIRASVVRDLLLGEVRDGLPGAPNPETYTTHSRGVELRKIRIVDDEGQLATLDIAECRHLRTLSLTDCDLAGLVVRHSIMDGPMLLRDCRIDGGIDAYGFQCRSLRLVGGRLGTRPDDDAKPVSHGDSGPVSLDAEHCDVRGEITLDGVQLCGSVILRDASARYLFLRKVTMAQAEAGRGGVRDSVIANRMTVHGTIRVLGCDFRTRSRNGGGALRFAGATVGNQFIMRASSAGQNVEGASALLTNMKISGRLLMDGEWDETPEKKDMSLSGDILLADTSASRILLRRLSARRVDARGASAHVKLAVGPDVTIHDQVDASGCHIGRFTMAQSHLGRILNTGDEASLLLRNAVIHGDLEIGESTEIRHRTDLHHIRVDGDVLITGPRPTACGPQTSCGTGDPGADRGKRTMLRSGRQGCALAADFASVRGELRVDQVTVDGSITLEGANVGQICLSRSEVGANSGFAINANRAEVRGPVVLGPWLVAHGPVRVEDAAAGFVDVCARIDAKGERSDHADCTCEPPGRTSSYALSLARTSVASDVRFNGEVTLVGALSLFASRIGGSLELGSARIAGRDDDGNSLVAARVHVENNLSLDEGFRSDGGLELRGGKVGGEASIQGDAIGANGGGYSVGASFLTTGGSISLRGRGPTGLDLGGAVDLRNASTKDLEIRSIRAYADPNGIAVIGDGVTAVRCIRLDRLRCDGTLSFTQCAAAGFRFAGTISVDDKKFCTALDLCGASIARDVILDNLSCTGHVQLRGASLGGLTMKRAEIGRSPDCRHSLLGPRWSFSLDAKGIDVKNDLDISYLSAANDVYITGATVGRDLLIKDLSGVEGRLWLNGTTVETIEVLDQPSEPDAVVVAGMTRL